MKVRIDVQRMNLPRGRADRPALQAAIERSVAARLAATQGQAPSPADVERAVRDALRPPERAR